MRSSSLVVPAGMPLEVELGCADARFSLIRARQEPTTFFAGIEIREEMVAWVNKRAVKAALPNMLAVFANMNFDLPVLFGPGRVRRYHLLFPDPWFKKRHHKRRVVNPELIVDLWTTLEVGGELHFASDVWDVALDAMAAFEEREDLFENLAGRWSFWKSEPFPARSKRDESCAKKKWPVWRLRYARIG